MKTKKGQRRKGKFPLSTHISRYSAWYFFFLAWLINIVIKCIQFPSLTVRPEVFAESGTNFFVNANYHPLWSNITATDAGYLPWTQRIIAVVAIKLFHAVSLYPYTTQWTAILFITFFCSLFI